MAAKFYGDAFDWEKELNWANTTFPAASGAFNVGPVTPALQTNGPIFYNVGVTNPAPIADEVFAGPRALEQAKEFAKSKVPEALKNDKLIREIREEGLIQLGDALVNLAVNFLQTRYHLAIFPLRGGRRLEVILYHMLPSYGPFEHVLFSEASSAPNDAFFTGQLQEKIAPHARDPFKLAIVDVGESGSGSARMKLLLTKLHASRYARQLWVVDHHTIIPPKYAASYPMASQRDKNIFHNVFPYVANEDLLDDWVVATALVKDKRVLKLPGGQEVLVALPRARILPGAVVIRLRDSYRVLASRDGTQIAHRIISDQSTAAAQRRFVRDQSRDRWHLR